MKSSISFRTGRLHKRPAKKKTAVRAASPSKILDEWTRGANFHRALRERHEKMGRAGFRENPGDSLVGGIGTVVECFGGQVVDVISEAPSVP